MNAREVGTGLAPLRLSQLNLNENMPEVSKDILRADASHRFELPE